MGSYTDVFGGETVNPAQLSYISYQIDDDLVLVWPLEAPPDATVAADKIDIDATEASLTVTLPPANQTSVGNDVLIRNTGTDTFSVLDSAGGALGTVASGEAWYFVLKTNATAAGTWYAIQFGAGTSSANAASLAGFGLRARASLLDQNLLTVPLLGNYAVTASDRASVLQNGSGAVTYTFASAATLANGFFVYVINAGSGNLTLDANGSETIDGSATKVLAPDETAMIFSDGSNLHSLGYGRSLVNTVTGASINVAGTGTYTLPSSEVAAQVQDYTGLLTGARIVDYGAVTGYWFVNNNTTGAFTLTARSGGLDAGVAITQGNFSILRSNGTNMEIAFSDGGGTVTSVATSSDMTGGPITTTGTLTLSNTGVAAGSYGSASETLTATVDAKGRLSALADTAIAITGSQVTDLSSIIAAAVAAAALVIVPVGVVFPLCTAGIPAGWLLASGLTIGNASSNATARANADVSDLYQALWNSDAQLLIYTSGGVLTTRGASAAADYAANKALALPDYRGRTLAGKDNMGGSAASRLTSTTMTPDGNSLGATGGAQTVTGTVTTTDSGTITGTTSGSLTVSGTTTGADVANVFASGTGGPATPLGHAHGLVGNTSGSLTVSGTFAGTGTGSTNAMNNVQPTALVNYIIKYA